MHQMRLRLARRCVVPFQSHTYLLHRNYASAASPHRVAVVGSGNWGSVAARIAAQNALRHPEFDDEVRMWVFEEEINGENLSSIINTKRENVKYLPGIDLGANLRAVPDLAEATDGASMLVFVTPHQFIKGLCPKIKS